MNSRHIKHISSSHYKKLQQSINRIAVSFDTEEIHQFRVTYKKLRAFLRLLSQQGNAAEVIAIAKKLKKGYTLLGNIRDLQLQQQRIKASNKNVKKMTPYNNLLQLQIDKLKPAFLKLITARPVTKSKSKTDAALPKKISSRNFKKFAQKNWHAVNSIIAAGNFSDADIHSIRKHLKDVFYNIKADDTFEDELLSMRIWKGKHAAYFNDLLNELGIFQDKCIAVTLLKPGWLKNLNHSTSEQLKQVKKIWTAEKTGIKKALVARFKNDFNFSAQPGC